MVLTVFTYYIQLVFLVWLEECSKWRERQSLWILFGSKKRTISSHKIFWRIHI